MRNKRMKFAIAAAIACIILLIAATLAYFTDRAQVQATGTAGTVSITVDDPSLLNPDGIDNFNPGDGRSIEATITNTGNKSVDVRRTFQVTMTPDTGVTFTDDGTTPMGWAIYAKSDCTPDADGNWVVNSGATALGDTVDNGDGSFTLTYTVPTTGDLLLNGTGDNAEIEAGVEDTSYANNDYVLAMLPGTDNSYQNATVTLDILVEAKQHRNTTAGWTLVDTVSVPFGGGTVDAVPAAAERSDGSLINP